MSCGFMAGDLKDKVAFCAGNGARVGEIGELVVEPEGRREGLEFRGPRRDEELKQQIKVCRDHSAGSPGKS